MKSIKTAVWVRVIALLCSMALVGAVLWINIGRINEARGDIAAAEAISKTAYSAEVAHFNWSSNLSSAVYAGTEFTGSVQDDGCVLGKWIYGDHGTTDAEILALIETITPLHKTIHSSASEVLGLLKTNPDAATSYYQNNTQKNITTLVGDLNKVVERTDVLIGASNEEMEAAVALMTWLSTICIVVALVCVISLVQYVLKQVVKPIIRITEESRGLADGVLSFNVKVKGKGELAQLSETLKRSVEEISGYVGEIDTAMGELAGGNFNIQFSKPFLGDFQQIETSISGFVRQLSKTIARIDQAAALVSDESSQIASASQSLSQGATQQAASVQELAATISDISGQVEDSAKSAITASQMSQETADELAVGKQQMSRMVQAMEDINTASAEIGKIIATIENIAFQTNILALNAAVEAARAGTAGKGFAVVADEVRNLASKSAEASQSTAALIENSIRSVQEGSQIAAETAQSLDKIVESSSHSITLIQQISEAAQTEAVALSQVTEGINQISAVVQMNTATAEESAATSEELSSQAQILKGLVEQFRLLDGTK